MTEPVLPLPRAASATSAERLSPTPTRKSGAHPRSYIYIACPWTPVGGGMFKVADYLIQAQSLEPDPLTYGSARSAELRPLDTRGARSAVWSLGVLAVALWRLVKGRCSGRLAGVHVNMAERLSLVRKSVVIVACHGLGLPVTLHLHAAQLHRAWPALPAPVRAVVRWVFSLPACCIVLGRESANFVQRDLHVPAQRIEVVVNGVPEPLHPRACDPQRVGLARLLFVGNLSDRKGVPELLQALAMPPLVSRPLELILAGGGDTRAYQAMAGRLGLTDRVKFAGWANQEQVAQWMSQADVLVLPSHDEGLPLVILEALASAVAVVCTPVGEIPHMLQDGVQARFVPPGDVNGLAHTLAAILDDATTRAAIARNGRSLYETTFSLPRFFDQIAAIHTRHFGVCGRRALDSEATRPRGASSPATP